MTEQRTQEREPRHEVALFVGSSDGALQFARTRNLSLTGVFVETESRPPVNSVHTVAFVWGEDTHECQARIVRHAEDGLGITFLGPDPTVLDALKEIIASSPRLPPAK